MSEMVPGSKSETVWPAGLHPGAIWRKTDFQVHTPRDAHWNGTSLPGTSEEDRRQRIEWAKMLIREARKRGLDAIAITDHHDLAYTEAIQAAVRELAGELQREFWAFVGMEVTCDDSCQCLVLLDPDTPLDLAERLYGAGFLNIQKHPYEDPRLPQTILSGIDLDKLAEHLAKDAGLKDRLLILPHAGKDKAHKTIFRKGFHARFAKLPVDGFYIEHPFAAFEEKDLRRFRGEDSPWGSRRRGVLSTGDNRSPDFSALGKNPCWVRMGESTVESLRQALLADEARIAFTEPALPSQRILRLEVDSTLCGQSLSLTFNDGFTAIIGGRGTGKSAILEYLRFGVGRSVFDVGGEQEGEAKRLVELIEETLSGGHVKVTMIRDGVEEVWRRDYSDHSTIEVTRGDSSTEQISIDVAQERFHARGYFQKQLSTLRVKSAEHADQITGIAAAELVAEQGANLQQIGNAATVATICLRKLVQRWDADALIERTAHRVKDLRDRRESLQAALKAKGISSEDQGILERASEYAKARQYFVDTNQALAELEGFVWSIKDLLTDRFPDSTVSSHGDFDAVRRAGRAVAAFKEQVIGLTGEVLNQAGGLKPTLEEQEKQFVATSATFDETYKKAQERQREHGELVAALVKLTSELEEAEKSQRLAEEQGKKLKGAEADFLESRKSLESLCHQRGELLEKAASHANLKSEHRLRALVFPYLASTAQKTALCSLLEGSRARDVEEQVRTYLDASDEEAWRSFCDGLIDLYRRKIGHTHVGAKEQPDSGTSAKIVEVFSFAAVIPSMAERIWQRLTAEKVEATIAAVPDAHIRFEYRDQAGQFIPFSQASAGEQAAALLTLLLNQQAGTLIIDQPEEDLDNRIIMEVVQLLRSTKRNRQIIFATHNANFVVNGDADKVVVVGSVGPIAAEDHKNKVAVALDGAIETPAVRSAITLIMEGGKEAFALRSRKYAFKER